MKDEMDCDTHFSWSTWSDTVSTHLFLGILGRSLSVDVVQKSAFLGLTWDATKSSEVHLRRSKSLGWNSVSYL